ncbi:monovalent cation/H+ antiporter complex subunit F [Streptomyces peucetius]|uniref:Monovalent cation/H+ antiporter complex subunit F n=1 Tax=Streptomyces peucetius TaxID=1950 RepID=A0ABY6I133_STRPE|nr:monovalent cation/H+ antiporter complex subunit F [Streptomyces peucetius]UYQ60578.1 monovalent cation/H+ antiporter complex subunit F [Streptomyces peucetius]
MSIVFTTALAMITAAALLTLFRLLRGPAALDRIVALDVLVTLVIAGTAVHAAARADPTPLPVLLVLALLAFIGSIAAAHLVEEREHMR